MKQVSIGFKNQIKELGREIDSIITYYNHYKFITEDNQYILTEDGQKILTEQINRDNVVEITAEDIYNEKIITHGDILSTMMKEFDFEVKQEMQIGSIVNVKFGVKVDGEYEYIDYGDFIVNQKEYKEDTKTYSYKAYDFMLLTMIPFKAPDLSEWSGEFTYYDLINYICEKCRLELGVELFANSDKEVDTSVLDFLEESNYTNRDVLDYVTELAGCSSYLIDNSFVIIPPQETSNVLPGGYTQVEYIQGSGSQYIDTLYTANSTTEIHMEFMLNNKNNFGLYGGQIDGVDTSLRIFGSGNNLYIAHGGDRKEQQNDLLTNTKYTLTHSRGRCSINETQYTSSSGISFADTTLSIFKCNGFGTSYFLNGKVYSFKIYDNNVLVRDFIPCLKNSNGVAGFYDIIGNAFYTNQGTGSFTYGNVVINPLTLYADSFKDTNVKFNEVFGPINSILLSRSEDTDVIEIKDDESIATNGVTQIKIKDNPFLQNNDRGDYLEEMFDNLNGLTYTLNDLDSIGITYLDYYDKYKVQIGENTYDCLLLNDEISINQGLEEKIFTEEYEGTTKEYVTSRLSDKDQKWANIQVKKDLGEISLEVGQKVNSDEVITAINLSPEQATIQANKIKLEGYTTINNGFSVDLLGNMTCNGAAIKNAIFDAINDTDDPSIILKNADNNTNYLKTTINPSQIHLTDTLYTPGEIHLEPAIFLDSSTYGNTYLAASGCYSPSFVPTSMAEKKKNFEKFNNALDILKDVDIYKYNLKFENDTDKKHIGFVIGEDYNYRKEITSKDNDGAELYSMISVLWQAVKEQQEEIEKLKERIDNK